MKIAKQVMSRFTGVALLMALAGFTRAGEVQTVMSAKDVKLAAAPAILPKGAMMAVLSGDPASSGPIVLRLKLPASYKIPAHWHPTDEHVTVLSGTFYIGMGDKLDPNQGHAFTAEGYAIAAAHMNHYAWTTTGATVQINLMGPFEMTYVDARDDPSSAKAK